jgi:ABC-2 type transport system ATP-binding protein
MLNKLREERQVTMLISSHDLNHITEVCDRICVLEKGKVVHDLPASSDLLKKLEDYFAA